MYVVEGNLHKYLTYQESIGKMVQVKSKVKIVLGLLTHTLKEHAKG
jgi:hypothetical protein